MPPQIRPYRIRRSRQARRVQLTVDGRGHVEITLPRGATLRDAERMFANNSYWIARWRRAYEEARTELGRRPGFVPYLGTELRLIEEEGRTRAHRVGATLLVPAGEDEQPAALERWYRRHARAEVAERLDTTPAPSGRRYTRLTIREQRTRWASCTSAGAMSFNWRLLLAPADVLDYVVWHEVCHLDVLDHSKRFWALVAERYPDHRARERWLTRFGPALVL